MYNCAISCLGHWENVCSLINANFPKVDTFLRGYFGSLAQNSWTHHIYHAECAKIFKAVTWSSIMKATSQGWLCRWRQRNEMMCNRNVIHSITSYSGDVSQSIPWPLGSFLVVNFLYLPALCPVGFRAQKSSATTLLFLPLLVCDKVYYVWASSHMYSYLGKQSPDSSSPLHYQTC